MNKTLQKIPGIGDIPVLGLLFKSQGAEKDRTELVVMITPEILPNNSPGVTPNTPRTPDTFLEPLDPKKSHEMPAPAFRTPGRGADNRAPQAPVAPAAVPAGDRAAAAKAQALAPTVATARQDPSNPAAATPTPESIAADKKALEDAQRDQQIRDEAARGADGKPGVRRFDEDHKLQDKASKEQARKDAEAAKAATVSARRQAEIDRAASEAAAKRAAEQAKKQAELDKKNAKSVSEAEAKLKAAQAAYESEVAKSKKQQQQ
jgi:hypothetical protein